MPKRLPVAVLSNFPGAGKTTLHHAMAAARGDLMRNLASPRARWQSGDAMAAHDRLPAPVRIWAAQAALPWSAMSLRKLWLRALRETGCPDAALARLSAAERSTLQREAAQVWGSAYPR